MPSHRFAFLRARLIRRALLFTLPLIFALAVTSPIYAQRQKKEENPRIVFVIEKVGEITVELFPKNAPKTVAHILDLVNKKFYDGVKFHRYVEGFVVQGGDPLTKEPEKPGQPYGTGGSGKNVPLEAGLSHERGTVGLARSQARDSGDSQFFFNLQDNVRLDGDYCVFGRVVSGRDLKGKFVNGLTLMDKLRQNDKIKTVRVVKTR
jgi:cyclophilin family peptidyl-prolyl cis-trans isomerase